MFTWVRFVDYNFHDLPRPMEEHGGTLIPLSPLATSANIEGLTSGASPFQTFISSKLDVPKSSCWGDKLVRYFELHPKYIG